MLQVPSESRVYITSSYNNPFNVAGQIIMHFADSRTVIIHS